jgi:phosphatidylethanolamine/phosphatidyl-N-methylethanolamine N-methyltransferase
VKILQGDAAQLGRILQQQANHSLNEVYAIVSSLPLRSIPKAKSDQIVGEWEKLTHPSACVVQYTYNICTWYHPSLAEFHRLRTRFAWWNLPPARIDLLTARK